MIRFNDDLDLDEDWMTSNENFAYTVDDAERDQMSLQAQVMLRFYDHMIMELEQLSGQMADFGMTHQLGLFLMNSVKMHRHTYEWCTRVLQERCPRSDDEAGHAFWMTAYRLLGRHVACWQSNPDYQEDWNPEAS